VPRFEPFAAVRYQPAQVELADVVAPPYDVIGPGDRARLEARSPYNVVHVDLARDDQARDRYDVARARFEEWIAAGVLAADPEPSFSIYAMGWRDDAGVARQTAGVLGALELDADRTGAVLPHERTMAKPLDDRLRLLRASQVNLSPIWSLSLAPNLGPLTEPSGAPLARCTDDDGVHHRLWRITSPAVVDAISAAVGAAPVVIADGHHRYETALAYRAERRAAGGAAGDYDLALMYVTPLDGADLGVRPIHRMLADLPDDFPLVEALAGSFVLEPAGPPADDLPQRMTEAGALGLVLPGESFLLRPRSRPSTDVDSDELADSERLEAALGALPAHDVAYHPDVTNVIALVDKGEAQAGVLLRPATVGQIAAAARAGRRLPQKTTFFYPKPRTGMAFRVLTS
jgi:uncharacterized protein (DUF1015 family)